MHPLQVAAQFAAFVWYQNTHPEHDREIAQEFARRSWEEFLPVAHEGLGRWLLQIGGQPRHTARRRKSVRSRKPRLIAAG